jgi:hypothetical protein
LALNQKEHSHYGLSQNRRLYNLSFGLAIKFTSVELWLKDMG